MTLFVCVPVYRPRSNAVLFRWNRIGGPLRCDILMDRFCSIRLISKDTAYLDVDLLEQRYSMDRIVISARREHESQRIAQAIHQGMNLRISAASGHSLCFILGFFPTIGALMHLAGCRIYGDVLKIRINGQCLKNCFKHSELLPFAKAAIDCLPRVISFRQFSPRCPSSGNPQHPIQCCAVITFCRASAFPRLWMFWRQYILDSIPLAFCEFISFCSHVCSLHHPAHLCKFYFIQGLEYYFCYYSFAPLLAV